MTFAATVAAQSQTDRLDASTTLGMSAVVFVGSRLFWRFGLSRYTGDSA